MKLILEIGSQKHQVLLDASHPISIPLHFNGAQPNTYDVDKASAKPYQAGDFIGSVAQGGDCNFESYTLVPHCNGTHTECLGHISKRRMNVHTDINDSLIPTTLITIDPIRAVDTQESYTPTFDQRDFIITRGALATALQDSNPHFKKALVIRTTPNTTDKTKRDYMKQAPAFFSHEAMQFIVQQGVQHLLVDLPSVDRMFDEGMLSNHRYFWEIEKKAEDIEDSDSKRRSITEMIFVPDYVKDDIYLLNLQMAAFMADAAPSRPILYALKKNLS